MAYMEDEAPGEQTLRSACHLVVLTNRLSARRLELLLQRRDLHEIPIHKLPALNLLTRRFGAGLAVR